METMIALTPPNISDPQIAIAACRAGALGLLDLGDVESQPSAAEAIDTLSHHAGVNGRWGVRLETDGIFAEKPNRLEADLQRRLSVLVLAGVATEALQAARAYGKQLADDVYLEVYEPEMALAAEVAGYDGVIVKGHEAGGRVSCQSSFILLQQLHQKLSIPYWIQGGMGLHTAAAALLAGATGVVLCEQLWLSDEAPFPPEQRAIWGRLDGSETTVIGNERAMFRFYSHSGQQNLRRLEQTATQQDWSSIRRALSADTEPDALIPTGQDIAFAAPLGQQYGTVGRIIAAFRHNLSSHLEIAKAQRPLAPNSTLARRHGTHYPIVQGPMTRVSDVVPFAKAVAADGGLPCLALGVMRAREIRSLLTEAKSEMGPQPWCVGLLGFMPQELRHEQFATVKEVQPPFAIVAGGQPSQAQALEDHGIATYLHVPSPGLLHLFIKQGARKFIFEGNECGGHVGPRSSFILWASVVETLLHADIDDPETLQILFAGGIHDALSAAMVASIAAPLSARGMHVGVLMGSAYLFTAEAVATGAILQAYQDQALACDRTVLLQSGPGYRIRGAKTPFCDAFNDAKGDMLRAGKSDAEILETLEELSVGRLRIASKGMTHNPHARDGRDPYMPVDATTQQREGMYMLGDVAALRHQTVSIADLHTDVSAASETLLARINLPTHASTVQDHSHDDIAIVGMACLFPGASDIRTFWHNILERVDAVREVSDDRWRVEDFFDPQRLVPDKIYAKWGGFLDAIQFDPTKYGIPPASLRSIEPVQLLALEVARLALADAGFERLPFERERTAVIFGIGGTQDRACDYIFRTMLQHYLPRVEGLPETTRQHIINTLHQQLPEWTEDTFPGILGNVLAGRVANRLDLHGSNFTVDAACASSLAALDVGIQHLRTGDADVALVGAVDGANNALSYMAFAKTHALSPQGRCRPFDESADGIAISEGVAALVLKRLSAAERDGDQIYAVIKGIGSSSDGRNRSLTAPHPQGQVQAVRRVCRCQAPRHRGLVEATTPRCG